jgi:hypothetical protein
MLDILAGKPTSSVTVDIQVSCLVSEDAGKGDFPCHGKLVYQHQAFVENVEQRITRATKRMTPSRRPYKETCPS